MSQKLNITPHGHPMVGVCQEDFLNGTKSCPENNFIYRKSPLFPIPSKYIDVVRRSTNNLDNSEERSDGVLIGTNFTPERWSGSTRFRILNKRPVQCYSWVDGRSIKSKSHRD